MRLPGRRLRNAAARLFTQPTMDRVIDPIVADLQAEYREAMLARRRWLAVWVCVRGYLGFWRAVGLQGLQAGPQSLWSGIATDGWWLGRMIGRAFIAFVGVTLALAGWPMIQFYSRVQDGLTPTLLLLPQAIPLSIPIAIPLAVVCGVYGERVSAGEIRRVLALAVRRDAACVRGHADRPGREPGVPCRDGRAARSARRLQRRRCREG